MPKGPKGQKRPADVVGNAILVAKIATGEVEEEYEDKDPQAVARGKRGGVKGGKARAEKLTADERRLIAKSGASARWGGKTK